MLSRLQPNEIAKIRNAFCDHIVYKSISEACLSCCERPKVYPLCQEQVFVEVCFLLDELKQNQKDVQWRNLFRNIRQDYHLQNTAVPDTELDCIALTIVYALASILAVSYPVLYHELAELLFLQTVKVKSVVPQDALDNLMNGIEKYGTTIAKWLKDYMDSDSFVSDKITSYIAPPQTIKGTYIRFTKTATIEQQAEFTSLLNRIITEKKTKGKAADIRYLLNKYISDNIIEISGTEKDIYDELVAIWGYNQQYNTFMAAEPKLIRKRD